MTDVPDKPETPVALAQSTPATPVRPDVSVLQDRVPPQFKASSLVAGTAAAFGLLYLVLSYAPIWHTDIWGHLSYGRWMAQTGHVPTTEPLVPLARGVPFVDTAWLSQWIGYQAISLWGPPAIQAAYALAVTMMAGLLAVTLYRRTSRVPPTVFGVLTFGWLNYQPLSIQRPQLAGMLCFTLLFCWLTSARWRSWYWFAVPALFGLWANLHGSFPIGLIFIALLAVGAAIDAGRHLKESAGALRFRPALRLVLLLELAAAAVLLNPYGIGLYVETLTFSSNPNLSDLVEWDPLNVRMPHGVAAAAVGALLALAYRMSPRRARISEALVLVALGAMALWHSRMLVWWSIPAAYYLGLHVGAVWKQKEDAEPRPFKRGGRWSVITLGIAWICFAYTPFGVVLLHGRPQPGPEAEDEFRQSVSRQTPVAAVKYLVDRNLPAPLFNTYEWGDYLLWAGPADNPPFVNSHAHLIPEEIWDDYMGISHGDEGWQFGLDRYGINTVLLDQRVRGPLIEALKRNTDWTLEYEDNVAAIFVRNNLIGQTRAVEEKQEATESTEDQEVAANDEQQKSQDSQDVE